MPRPLTLRSILIALAARNLYSQDAMTLINFFSYFEGTWELTDLGSGEKGTMTIGLGTGGTSHVLELKIGAVERTELWGFDPATKQWTAAGFGRDGERFTQVMLEVPHHETPRVGDRWLDQHDGLLPSGEKTAARLEFTIDSEDQYTVVTTHATLGDQLLPDSTLACRRKT